MLNKAQAIKILDEDKDYEEKMFRELAKISINDLMKNDMLDDREKDEIIEILKVMVSDTLNHEKMIDYLIKYVYKRSKDEY